MVINDMTYTVPHTVDQRARFARILRSLRNNREIRAYGRMGAFGRSIITHNNVRVLYPVWTSKPNLNLHYRRKGL